MRITDILEELNFKNQIIQVCDISSAMIPHEYKITEEHLNFINEHYKGIQSPEALKHCDTIRIKCGVMGCNTSYEDHKIQKIAKVKVLKNATTDQFKNEVCKLTMFLNDKGIALDGIIIDLNNFNII